MKMTAEQRRKALLDARKARLEGRPVDPELRAGAAANERARRQIHKIRGGASQARNGWKKPTEKQVSHIRDLEEGTGTEPRDLSELDRVEAGDYITVLRHRRSKLTNR